MNSWHVYLRKKVVYIPKVGKTEAGFFIDLEPVVVLDQANLSEIKYAIAQTISMGNALIKTPTRNAFPAPVVLAHARVKTWRAFEKSAFCWIITKLTTFSLCPQRRSPTGGWEDDCGNIKYFGESNSIDDVAEYMASCIKEQSTSH